MYRDINGAFHVEDFEVFLEDLLVPLYQSVVVQVKIQDAHLYYMNMFSCEEQL